MSDAPIKLLFIEDSPLDMELAVAALKRDGLQPEAQRVDSEDALRQALNGSPPDAILSDFSMPSFNGMSALSVARELAPQVPFIFVSGTIGEERAIEAIRSGATDYVLKDSMRRLGTAVKRALSEAAERKAYEARIQYLANYDALSGLPNRTLLGDRAAQAIAHARRNARNCALLVLNVDRFNLLNESYGHAAGDALLKLVAERVSSTVREGDTCARLGADSFAVLAADLARPDDILNVVRKIRESMAVAFSVDGRDMHVTLSIGIGVSPRDGDSFELLLRNADAATSRVKSAGGNALQFYAAEMTQEAIERLELENALRSALARGQIELHYQPQIDIASGRIAGLEALMRWKHPQRGLVSPVHFIPIAEESDLIQQLGVFALMDAAQRLAQWHAAGHRVRVAVNVSGRQFASEGFMDAVARALRTHEVDPAFFELELTETALIEDRDKAVATLRALKRLGVQIAVDDFGTGYSSLSYLSGLPVDCVKIDRAFVMQIARGGRDSAIAQAVVSLGHALGLRVLAEGVETPEQLAFLRSHDCDEGQGYLFSKACTPEAASALLRASPSDK